MDKEEITISNYNDEECLIWINAKAINVFESLRFIKNRAKQGASQKEIDKMAIELVKNYLKGDSNE